MPDIFPQKALLPNGMTDLLVPEAAQETHLIVTLLKSFQAFGYLQIKPPLVEFEESLLSGPGKALAQQTFRLMDTISHQMMGVRADVTAQIARIASTLLKEEARPLRLSYAADVLRVSGTQLRPERQFCQVGCEMVGVRSIHDDVEAALVAIKALHEIGVKDISIDLTVPNILEILSQSEMFQQDDWALADKLLKKRDRDGLKESGLDSASFLMALLDCSGVAEAAFKKLKSVTMPASVQPVMKDLEAVVTGLQNALQIYNLPCQMTIDLVERNGFSYQSGVSYTLFSPHIRGELGRGGRYEITEQEEACGFTLYMDSMRQAAAPYQAPDTEIIAKEESWEAVKALQDKGLMVIRK